MTKHVTPEDKALMKELYPELKEEDVERAAQNFKRYARILSRVLEKRIQKELSE